MRLIKGSVIGLVLAGMMMLGPTAVFARGGGHGGGHGFGGGHFGGFGGRGSGFHGGGHHWYGGPYWDVGWWGGDPYWGGNPYYSYYDDNSAYSEAAPLQPGATSSRDTVIAVQQELARLGYYHGPVDGVMGPKTRQAIRWFQSVDKLPVTGLVDDATLKGLQIS
jgi:Putative peptidoglycan binding domain